MVKKRKNLANVVSERPLGCSGVVHFYFLRRLLRANKWLLKTSTNNVPSLALIMFG